MTPPLGAPDAVTLLAPVKITNGRFRITNVGDLTDRDFQAALRASVVGRFTTSDEYVEFNGRLFRTRVHVSDDGAERYAELDAGGAPIDLEPPGRVRSLDRLHHYLDRVLARAATSDGISADTEISISDEFVEPNVSWMESESGGSGSSGPLWQEVRHQARLVLIGAAGMGKTTLLRRVAHECARESLTSADPTIPIYIQLRSVAQDIAPINELAPLVASYDRDLGQLLSDDRSYSRVLLILDGLDEVPDEDRRQRLLDLIGAACIDKPKIRIILATRESAYKKPLEGFSHARIGPFDTPRITQWASQYLASHSAGTRWRHFTDHLFGVPDIAELAGNPLLLSMIAYMYARERVVPENRALIYQRCIEVLLQGWDVARGVTRWPDSPAMVRQMRSALMTMSFKATSDDRVRLFVDDLSRPSEEMIGFRSSPKAILDACHSTGVLERRAGDYTFAHQTFQEYFAARSLIDSTEDIRAVFTESPARPSWDRIWIMSCAMASDATDLLEARAANADTMLLHTAALLADAFSQDVTATRTVVRRASEVIRNALEQHRQELNVDIAPRVGVWALWLARDEETPLLKRVLEAVYMARLGTAAPFIAAALESSEHSVIRHIAVSMRQSGRHGWLTSDSHDSWIIYGESQSNQDPE